MKVSYRCGIALLLAAVLFISSVFPAWAVEVSKHPEYVWVKEDGDWTCTDADGQPVTGWAMRGDDIYYLNKNGIPRKGWVKYENDWFYMYKAEDVTEADKNKIGTLATEVWIDNYYVDKTGAMTKTR